ADRNAYVADPAYFAVPLNGLLSKHFAATRRALITPTAATSPVPPGDPYPLNGGGPAAAQATVTSTQPGAATNIRVPDRAGDAAAGDRGAARERAEHADGAGRACLPREPGGGGAAGARPRLQLDAGDRGRDRDRVPRRRQGAGRRGTGAARRRERDGRVAVAD